MSPGRPLSTRPLLLATLWPWLLATSTPAGAQPLELRARWLEAGRRVLAAEGEVRLRLGSCVRVEAASLRLRLAGARPSFEAEGVLLEAGALRLRALRLSLDEAGGLQASFVLGTPCACPGAAPLLQLAARRAWIAPGGARLHLRSPALQVGGRRILAIPYLALPLRRGVSGLLLPELGWSGRDGVRLYQGGYLAAGGDGRSADLGLGAGWIESRGPLARVQGRLFLDGRAHADLALLGLRDGDRHRGWLRGELAAWGRGLAFGLAPDLASDGLLLSELEREPERALALYLRSRAWASLERGPVLLLATADLFQAQGSPLRGERDPSGVAGLLLELAPVRLLGPLQLRLSAAGHLYSDAALRALAPGLARGARGELDGVVALGLAERLGLLAVSGQLGYRGMARGAEGGAVGLHAGLASVEVALPLARRFQRRALLGLPAARYQHRVEPFAGALWTALDGEDPIRAGSGGGFVSLGFRTGLVARSEGGALLQLAHNEMRFDLPFVASRQGTAHSGVLASGSFGVGPASATHLVGRWRWSPSRKELLELRGEACLRLPAWLQSCAGYHRQREAAVEDGFQLAAGSWITDPAPDLLALGTVADQVVAALRAELGAVSAWARIAIDPRERELSLGSYGVVLRLGCGCTRVEVAGQSRAGQRWPDLFARVSLSAPGLRCDDSR